MKTRNIAPDYWRIPHFNKEISNMTHDDIELESPIDFPLECYVQEKVDGANMGISWFDGPILRNRSHILKKGYIKRDTPAKLQFRPAWNWLHQHEDDIKLISELCYSPVTIYGEWLYAKHSIYYDKLPDLFLAYDIWSVEDREFLSPEIVSELLDKTNIKYINSSKITINSINDVIKLSEVKSQYRDGMTEGIVIKTSNDRFIDKCFKVVNKNFKRREDFNEILLKNKTI
jgi:hypothetical protein